MDGTKKLEEGFAKIRAAEKSLKTSLLKWKPDYDVAADEYNQAATCFKSARSFERSKDCLLKAAECHQQVNAFFHAAKCYDQAILISKELNDYPEIVAFAEKACYLYQQHGSPESAASCLEKAAKILEANEPEQALKLYQKAAEVVMIEDSPRQAAQYMDKVARLMIKLNMYDQATDAIRREISLHEQSENIPSIGRLAVGLILVQLARGDYVAAEKAFKEWGNCCESQEIQNLELLLRGFDEEDPDAVRQALQHPFIRHMDVEYARLARDLPLPEGIAAPKPKILENVAPSYISPNSSSSQNYQSYGQFNQEKDENSAPEKSDVTESKQNADDDEDEGLC